MTDPRPRNNQGQFAPDEQGGMDPNTTSAAYNPQIIESRKATLAEKLRRAIGVRRGVEESVPQEQRVLSRFNHGGHGERGGVKEFAEYKPSKEAEALKEASLVYNKFLNDSGDWRAASESDKGLRLRRNHEIASKLIHQRGIDSRLHLPFGIGKKAKDWKQYNKDMDWVNSHLSAKLRLRELAQYNPYEQSSGQGQPGGFRNAAIGIGALAAGGGVAYAGFRGAQAAKSAQTLTDDALKTSGEARKAARSARVAVARVNRAGKVLKTQLTTFPTFKKAGSAIFRAGRARYLFQAELGSLKELAARSVEFAKEISVDDISGNYVEHPGRKRHIVGGVAGSAIGAVAGMGLAAKLKAGSGLGIAGAIAGGAGGSMLADPRGSSERRRQMREARHAMREAWQTNAVPVESIKSDIPIASSYMGVAGELKKQKVGFFKRHAAALSTGAHRSGENAAFLPYGEKGVIVSPKRVPKVVIRHEQGHGKDYKIHGDFEKVYPRYGENTWDAREYLQNTLLPEERAWRHAKARAKNEIKLKNAALGSYAAGGGFTRKYVE